MANFDIADIYFQSALKDCSPNVVRFLQGLHDSTGKNEARLNYTLLNALHCVQHDGRGDYFRCISFTTSDGSAQSPAHRSYKEQLDIYKRGRRGTYTSHNLRLSVNGVAVPKILQGAWHEVSFVETSGTVYTNCFAGASYHNYGLAVDICLRHFGDSGTISADKVQTIDGVKFDTLRKVYEKTGILAWAKKCGLRWGGDWSDFPDFGHFEDTAYKPLPDLRYADGLLALRNTNTCNFETCKKYWAGEYDDELKTFEKALKNSGVDSPVEGSKGNIGGFPFLLLVFFGVAFWLVRGKR